MNLRIFSDVNPLAGDSASAWQELVNKIGTSIDAVFGSLAGLFALSAVVLLVVYAAKGGFTNDPSKRKASLVSMGVLSGLIVFCIIIWSLRSVIINLVAGAAPAPGSFFNLLMLT